MTTPYSWRRLLRPLIGTAGVALTLGACAELPSAPAGKPAASAARSLSPDSASLSASRGAKGRRGGYNVVAD